MSKMTFWDIIEITLDTVKQPMTPRDIWENAKKYELIGDFFTTGKTPWQTIGAYCYSEIRRNGENSMLVQVNKSPPEFYLRRHLHLLNLEQHNDKKNQNEVRLERETLKHYKERDLHCLLSAFVYTHPHFKANTKTIFHENSAKANKGKNEWLHPDIVGVYFPYPDYEEETLQFQNHLNISSIKLFSFELKINLNFSNLRQYYFQAVSNSSWANEGYLVVLNMDDDPVLMDEIRRLNNAFGIGIIKLNPSDVHESEILFPSRINDNIDWDTVNRLNAENKDFLGFLKSIIEDCKLGKVKSTYDEIKEPEFLKKWVEEKGMVRC